MHGECGHIKSHWDYHDNCLKCSCCSRESNCNMCSSWTERTWKLAEKRRTYASRKWVMSKKKKRSQAMSDSSDEGKIDGNTIPHGPAAGGRPIKVATLKVLVPRGTGQPTTGHLPTGQEDITDWPPVTGQMGITHGSSSQSITSHWPSSHWSLDLQNINTGESQFSPATGHQTLYQSTFSDTHAMGMEFTTNRANLGSEQSFNYEVQNPANNSKRVLLPLEPDFSNMSDPSIIIELPDNNWRSDNRQVTQTSLSGRISRMDQSRSKHKCKKKRSRRSSSTSSSSRSASSDSRKRSRKSKRSKHSHKKRRRHTSSSSSSSLSNNQSHDYGRYKRSRHSPQAVQNPSMLQPAEITNAPTTCNRIRLFSALQRTGSDLEIETWSWSFDRAINEFFRLLSLELCPRPAEEILRQSLYLALNI